MRIVVLTSTERRHTALVARLAAEHEVAAVVREEKGLGNFYQGHPDEGEIARHFARLAETERKYFADAMPGVPAVDVARGELNSAIVAGRIAAIRPEAAVVFGPGIIKSPVIEVLPAGKTINLHQGLSPYYRGSGTNFWPFVEQRIEFIGVTAHHLDPGVDTGGIIAHARPLIHPDDNLHDIGCRTVEVSVELALNILRTFEAGEILPGIAQWEGGRVFRRRDLDGDAIRRVRQLEADGMVRDFVARRERGEIPPVRLISLD